MKNSIKNKPKDIRTLCYPCFCDMYNAGFKLEKVSNTKHRCDKCNRQGVDYWLKQSPKRRIN